MVRREIEYREYKRQDNKELTKLLAEQVYNKFFEKEKDAERYSRYILKNTIRVCKHRKVALVGNKVVGVILGMKEKGNALLYFVKQKICHLQLMVEKKNRQALKCLLLLDEMEQEFLNQYHVDDESRIVIFLVAKGNERQKIQDELLNDWETKIENMFFYMILNGRMEQGLIDKHCYQKIDERSVSIQPKDQRIRFYKILYAGRGYM